MASTELIIACAALCVAVVLFIVNLLMTRSSVKRLEAAIEASKGQQDKINALITAKGMTLDGLFENITKSKTIQDKIEKALVEDTYTISNKDAIYSKASSMMMSAQSNIRAIWCLTAEAPPAWYGDIGEAKIRSGIGVTRLLNMKIPKIREAAKNLISKYGAEKNFRIYHTDQRNSELMIVDDKEALLTFPSERDNQEIGSAIYTNNPKFVEAMMIWYDHFLFNENNRVRTAEEIERIPPDFVVHQV